MAPPGTKVIVHNKTTKRPAWSFHGDEGFYIGPALEHYRCIECLIQQSNRLCLADTIFFFPHNMEFPTISLSTCLTTALDKIVSTLAGSTFWYDNPSLPFDDETMAAINTAILQVWLVDNEIKWLK